MYQTGIELAFAQVERMEKWMARGVEAPEVTVFGRVWRATSLKLATCPACSTTSSTPRSPSVTMSGCACSTLLSTLTVSYSLCCSPVPQPRPPVPAVSA